MVKWAGQKGHLHYSKNFVELGWWVGDGDEWHHDEIRIDFGLVWSCFAWLCWCHCRFIVDYTVDSISCPSWYLTCLVSFRFLVWLLLGLTWLVSGIVVVMMIPLSQIRGLTYWESNPMSKIQEVKWAGGNSGWYCLFISQTMHFLRFATLHTNVKWQTDK